MTLRACTLLLVLLLTAGAFAACAGPATPLGAPWATSAADVRNGPLSFITSLFKTGSSEIRFKPARQILHGPSPMRVTIKDPHGVHSNYNLVVRHNGLDVTTSFLRQAEVHIDKVSGGEELTIEVPVIRLSPDSDHLIEVIYEGPFETTAYARYEAPICNARGDQQINRIDGFAPRPEIISRINRISRQLGFSPAFTAALIAQESSFNPRTVSWAKAIGLTQVTPAAENEIIATYADWPRYPGLNDLPALFVKALVAAGSVNPSNEWRLDDEHSIYGGLAYAQLLAERWSTPENMERIHANFADADGALTKLILASYNSGYARVAQALGRLGPAWLTAPELREARRYVNRISSFCDYFSTAVTAPDGTDASSVSGGPDPGRAPAARSFTNNGGRGHEKET